MIELMLFDAKVTYNDKDGWKCSNPDVLSLVQSLASNPPGFQYVPWKPLTVVEKLQEDIAGLLNQNTDFMKEQAILQQQIEARKKALREAKIQIRDFKKEANKWQREKGRLEADNGALSSKILDFEEQLRKMRSASELLNRRFEEVSGYLIDLVTFADKNR